MQRDFHNVFVVSSEVYSLAGPSVFEELAGQGKKRNVVVVTSGIIAQLDEETKGIAGSGARDVLEYLNSLKLSHSHVKLDPNQKLLRVSDNMEVLIVQNSPTIQDLERIIESTEIRGDEKSEKPILVTSDPVLQLQYKGGYFAVEPPQFLMVNRDIVHKGVVMGDERLLAALTESENESLPIAKAMRFMGGKDLYPNQFVKFITGDRPVYARVTGKPLYNKDHTMLLELSDMQLKLLGPKEYSKAIRIGEHSRESIFGISPNDMEQYLAMQYGLFDDDISVFILSGGQGTGKTLLTYVSSVDQVVTYLDEDQRKDRKLHSDSELAKFRQIVLFTPIDILGGKSRDLGSLPGNAYQKLQPHLAKYEDQHNMTELGMLSFQQMLRHPHYETDFGPPRNVHTVLNDIYLPSDAAAVTVVHTGFLRGRSFTNIIAWIDEAQNMTPYEMKTIIQRLGHGCKIIITGDPDQTDNPKCTREINGLTHAARFFLNRPYAAIVHLERNYRSQASKEADSWRVYGR